MSSDLKNALADLDGLSSPAPRNTKVTTSVPDVAFPSTATLPPSSSRFRRPVFRTGDQAAGNSSASSAPDASPRRSLFPKPGQASSASSSNGSSLIPGGSPSRTSALPPQDGVPPSSSAALTSSPTPNKTDGQGSAPTTSRWVRPGAASVPTSVAPASAPRPAGASLFARKTTVAMDEEEMDAMYEEMRVANVVLKPTPPATPEQAQVIECESRLIKVKAFAGAGKTSTLVGYANRRPRAKMLYIAFNRDIKDEAKRKFGSNVKCMTSHGVAYGQFGVPLQEKLKIGMRWRCVYEATRIKLPSPSLARVYARVLVNTVANFVASAEPLIGRQHLPHEDIQVLMKNEKIVKNGGLPDAPTMAADAERLWAAMIDPSNLKIGASHDAYLKLMQLAMPSLPYDVILLDEAQDSNPALLSLVQRQTCTQVLVGDPHQAIYGFRKAVDAMSQATADTTLELTGSFRFGPEIADFANAMLAMKGESSSIRGLGESGTVGTLMGRSGKGRSAFITRTNAVLFTEAAERAQTNQKLYFAGGLEGAGFDLLRDLHHLYFNQPSQVKDPLLAAFASYADFKSAVEENEEIEWIARCKLVEGAGRLLPARLQAIERNCVSDITLADQVFSTAHKSKGLEFDHVVLGQDFHKAQASKGAPSGFVKDIDAEETNALYVAATRAKKSLVITDKHWQFWKSVSPMLDPALPQERRTSMGLAFPPEVNGHLEKVALLRGYDAMMADRTRSYAPQGGLPEGSREQITSINDFVAVLTRPSKGGEVGHRDKVEDPDPFDGDPFLDPPKERPPRKRL